jgi:hypothetical protein
MIKATMTAPGGRQILLIGLSHRNLDKLKADGMNGYIPINDIGLPFDVIITAAPTEDDLTRGLEGFIGPKTQVFDRR